VGTSGFAYPAWAPAFYPRRLDGRAMLAAYAARLTAVELNSTFYRRPSASVVAGWLTATPEAFRFCPRAQRGTAFRALRSGTPDDAVAWLVESLAPFGGRLGCVLLSVPATIPRDDAALAGLLTAWPGSVGLALELAHPSWVDDAVHEALRERRVALVATDADVTLEPDLRRSGPALYLRLRRRDYTEGDLARWARRLEPFLESGLDVFAFFRHDTDGMSALRAERLAAILGQPGRSG
jgi:uncharacterized protein YecE (DUF72 family)